jgi:predicted transposase YbfD/YdcC
MGDSLLPTIEHHFGDLTDPRVDRTKLHELLNILVIAICAVIAGADGWEDVEEFGQARLEWFQTFLELPNGIPSHDTFTRVFARLDPQQFQACFMRWMSAVAEVIDGQVIAIDGKVLRRSHDKGIDKAAIDMVSAWASANHLVLGQVKVDEKSNEITAIPQLLAALEVSGCIVTIDAMGTQIEITKTIREAQADYLLSVKENHALIEVRECWSTSNPEYLKLIRNHQNWAGLQSIIMLVSTRLLPGQETRQVRYYISSLPSIAQRFLQISCRHWAIENELHWVLDVAMNGDHSRVRKDQAPENFAVLRHIALNLLKLW